MQQRKGGIRMRVRVALSIAAAVVAFSFAVPGAASAQGLQFTDWTASSNNVAGGALNGTSVTLAGTHVWPAPVSELDGGSNFFEDPALFTPPLPRSDHIQISGIENGSYTLSFGSPVTEPTLHIASLASTIQFPPGTQITRISGSSSFSVSGTTVTGNAANVAGGTIRLSGRISSIGFTATALYEPGVEDGIVLQVGAAAESAPPSPPPPGRNVSPPHIVAEKKVLGGTRYRCSPGTWEGLQSDPRFEYVWYRQGNVTGVIGGRIRGTPSVQVASSPTYTLPPAAFGKRYFCVVSVRDGTGRLLIAYSESGVLSGRVQTIRVLAPRAYGNFRIRGIDVFQIVQPNSSATMFGFPSGPFTSYCGGGTPTSYGSAPTRFCGLGNRDPQRTIYNGVPLDQRKPTTAIVYVAMDSVPSDPAQQLNVTLTAKVGGLSGSVTKRFTPPTADKPWVSAAERADPKFGVRFPVSASWLAASVLGQEPLELEATVALPVGAGSGALQECLLRVIGGTDCTVDDRFQLDGLPVFDDLADLTVRSLALLAGDQSLRSPDRVLRRTSELVPGGERLTVLPYDGVVIDITREANLNMSNDECDDYADATNPVRACRMANINLALDGWWAMTTANRRGYDILMAVHNYSADGTGIEPRWTRRDEDNRPTTILTPGKSPTIAVNDGSAGRPLTAATHEFMHALGAPHADTAGGCGGNVKPQVAEPWPPDNMGRLQGTGFNRTTGGTLVDGTPNSLFDLMSYCGGETNSWLSARNWNRAFQAMRGARASSARVGGDGRPAGASGGALAL